MGSGTSAGHAPHAQQRRQDEHGERSPRRPGRRGPAGVRARPHSQPAATSDRPMMFRMSTFSIPYRRGARTEDVGLQAEQQRQPEDLPAALLQASSSPRASDAPRRMRACAASGTARPASQRNSGAPMPAITMNQKYARVWRVAPDHGPRIDHVREDHDDDRQAAHPVDVAGARPGRRRGRRARGPELSHRRACR